MAKKIEQRRWSPWTPADNLKVIDNLKLPSSVIADLLSRTTNAVEFRRAHIASKLTMLRDEALPDAWCCSSRRPSGCCWPMSSRPATPPPRASASPT